MKTAARPTLTLPTRGLVDAAEDRSLPIAVYDVLLPCRKFRIDHKVAVLGRVSLTAEFLLRLVRSLDGMFEQDAAGFFGFDHREMSYVMREVEELGFLARSDGRLWLTTQGHSLFREGLEHPEIFEVEQRSETIGFDLLSLAPQRMRSLELFERRLPELQLKDAERVSGAGSRIPHSFRRFYSELVTKREHAQTVRRALYSIDRVSPGERFQASVRLVLTSSGLRPSHADIDLDEWRPPHEQDERPEIRVAASEFRDSLVTSRRPDDGDAYQLLLELNPGFLKDFTRSSGLAVERYYREAFMRAGEPRADRPSIPLLGSLLLHENVRRLTDVLSYGLRSQQRPRGLLWIAPQVPYWGASSLLPAVLRELIRSMGHPVPELGPVERTVCVAVGREAKYLEEAFGRVQRTDTAVVPRCLELLILPGILAAVAVHSPIGLHTGLPVPLGFISFDPQVLARTSEYCNRWLPDDLAAE